MWTKIENNLRSQKSPQKRAPTRCLHQPAQFNPVKKRELGRDRSSMDTRNWPDWISLSPAGIESIRTAYRQMITVKWSRVEREYMQAQSGSLSANYRAMLLLRYTQKLENRSENESRTTSRSCSFIVRRGGEERGGRRSSLKYVIRFVIIINIEGGGYEWESYVKWNLRGNRDWGRSLLGERWL